jgi:hypothetical protein
MLLQHEDLDQLSTYTRDLNRLLFKSFFGCGVVCGLVVKPDCEDGKPVIALDAGLAINCTGDPIYVPKSRPSIVIPERDTTKKDDNLRWVLLCPYKKSCFPRTLVCAPDDDDNSSTYTRDRDGFEIKIVAEKPTCCVCEPYKPKPADPCLCADPTLPCLESHYKAECGCDCDNCAGSGCDCVVLALLTYPGVPTDPWKVDHSVRRFIRPLLMRDPVVEKENQP